MISVDVIRFTARPFGGRVVRYPGGLSILIGAHRLIVVMW